MSGLIHGWALHPWNPFIHRPPTSAAFTKQDKPPMPTMIARNRGRRMNPGQPIMPNMIARNGVLRMDQGHPAMLRVVKTGNFGHKRGQSINDDFHKQKWGDG